ncbi:Protein MAK16-like protein [Coemansia sp. RSA 1822]|nr:Protein MAK16-like protein [Coemansia sp. RSA 638]KAJ2124294.1 Protein MAK16-like protein [Coemansia sp. RSA 720]KAJ2544473.1 Protein MAK16-like protein [Coemansia sp. RSA 1853]KAJ2565239.1 Protein MAK16-like protein [Coemansia sp. RSA 1822]KAJ2666616.1 Protein MAK16 [Coemansia sp. RSA 1199]
MNNDGIIWEVLNNQFCSFKIKTDVGNLCRHPHNLTGRCNRKECPLANSKYATVRETNGRIHLCLKTAERAHMPAKQWEKIELPRNYAQAVAIIDENMQYWPGWMINICKQRLTKITQYLIRMRKLKLKSKHTLVPIKKKLERREKSREIRAEAAARLDQSIEKELLERLKSKAYGDQPLNVNEAVWNEILGGEAMEAESDATTEDELEDEDENEYELDDNADGFAHEFVSDDSDDDEDDVNGDMEDLHGMSDFSSADDEEAEESDSDDEDAEESDDSSDDSRPAKGKRSADSSSRQKPSKRTKKHGPRVEIEYEAESPAQDNMITNW